jgi:hypothetical protein
VNSRIGIHFPATAEGSLPLLSIGHDRAKSGGMRLPAISGKRYRSRCANYRHCGEPLPQPVASTDPSLPIGPSMVFGLRPKIANVLVASDSRAGASQVTAIVPGW